METHADYRGHEQHHRRRTTWPTPCRPSVCARWRCCFASPTSRRSPCSSRRARRPRSSTSARRASRTRTTGAWSWTGAAPWPRCTTTRPWAPPPMWPTGAPSTWTSSCAASSKSRKTASSPTSTRTWPSRTSCLLASLSPRALGPHAGHHGHHPARAERRGAPRGRAGAAGGGHRRVGQDVGAHAAHRVSVLPASRRACDAEPGLPHLAEPGVRPLHRPACCPTSASATRKSSPGRSSCTPLASRRAAAWARATCRLSACTPSTRPWHPSSSTRSDFRDITSAGVRLLGGDAVREGVGEVRATCRPARTVRRSCAEELSSRLDGAAEVSWRHRKIRTTRSPRFPWTSSCACSARSSIRQSERGGPHARSCVFGRERTPMPCGAMERHGVAATSTAWPRACSAARGSTSVEWVYLKMALTGLGNPEARYVMIDEAQDYSAGPAGGARPLLPPGALPASGRPEPGHLRGHGHVGRGARSVRGRCAAP